MSTKSSTSSRARTRRRRLGHSEQSSVLQGDVLQVARRARTVDPHRLGQAARAGCRVRHGAAVPGPAHVEPARLVRLRMGPAAAAGSPSSHRAVQARSRSPRGCAHRDAHAGEAVRSSRRARPAVTQVSAVCCRTLRTTRSSPICGGTGHSCSIQARRLRPRAGSLLSTSRPTRTGGPRRWRRSPTSSRDSSGRRSICPPPRLIPTGSIDERSGTSATRRACSTCPRPRRVPA